MLLFVFAMAVFGFVAFVYQYKDETTTTTTTTVVTLPPGVIPTPEFPTTTAPPTP